MTETNRTALESVLRRDRAVVIAILVGVITLAWIYILLGAGTGMTAIDMVRGSEMPTMPDVMVPVAWTLGYAGLMFVMWWAMMAAMMLPSAAPVLLLFAQVNRHKRVGDRPYVPTAIFAGGYLVAWGGFSALAVGLQWELQRAGLLSAMMATTSYWLGGAILLAAGVWQLSPIKRICLRHCRSPMGFLVQSWRPGRLGAFRMGLEHGSYCLGCCWFLMWLLFFGGIMNLFWIAGLAVFILMEKTIPMGSWLGRIVGFGVAAWGAVMLVTTTLTIAAPNAYRFEAAEVEASGPGKTTVVVRLVHLQDKEPVKGAVITEAKTDMGPEGMPQMSGAVLSETSKQPGLYRFLIETGMPGKWELVLTAKVPGEPGPISGKITYNAK
jgi:predicted metal-binding membrane protein